MAEVDAVGCALPECPEDPAADALVTAFLLVFFLGADEVAGVVSDAVGSFGAAATSTEVVSDDCTA